MGYSAIWATQASDHTTPPYGIYIDGTFVSLDRSTHRFGVDIDSILLSEAGPGGVSALSFSIDDPYLSLAFADGARIEYWDLRNGWPIFSGFLQAPTVISDFGEQGRRIEVVAYGIEALLDEIIVPALTLRATDTDDASIRLSAQEYIALIGSFGPLRAIGSRAGVDPVAFSSQARPIENRSLSNYVFGVTVVLAVDGQSLRGAMESMLIASTFIQNNATAQPFISVDFYGGLRAFLWGGTYGGGTPVEWPSDYVTITISDTSTGAIAAANLTYTKDLSPGVITNAVYVKGATAAATGWVVGDTSTGRHEQYVTIAGTTNEDKIAAGQSVLSNRGVAAGRGELDLLDLVPVNTHPGGQLIITDGPQGWVSKSFVISAITKTFRSNGHEDWHVSFLDPTVSASAAGPPSVTQLVRTLTRTQS